MADVDEAIRRAVDFLAATQLPSGEVPVAMATRRDMVGPVEADPAIFPTALAAHCLAFAPEAAAIRERALGFLTAQRDRNGLWKHWPKQHPQARYLPPDLDDTACASAALGAVAARRLMLANRDRRGLFLTWVVPRPRWMGFDHLRVMLPWIPMLPGLWLFFRKTSAKPGDVDAVVNANCLHCLGEFSGREAVAAHLLEVLRTGSEARCDKWYDNPFAVWYFFARALGSDAREMLEPRLAQARPETALDHALALGARLSAGLALRQSQVRALLALQDENGGWPRAALYHGGRARLAAGGFAAPHPDTPHWGSEAVTTAFAVEALARWRVGGR